MHQTNEYQNKSTGNDVVALNTINKQRSNNFNFFSKILSHAELALYYRLELANMPFENYVWLLWTVKESVYKYLKRTTPALVFSPTKIDIRQLEPPFHLRVLAKFPGIPWESGDKDSKKDYYQGIAHFGSGIFYFRSRVNEDVIATVVSKDATFEHMEWGLQIIDHSGIGHPAYDTQSKGVRAFILARLNFVYSGDPALFGDSAFSGDPALLSIGKSPFGCPIVLKGPEELKIPVSLAHHERFIAYSFIVDPGII